MVPTRCGGARGGRPRARSRARGRALCTRSALVGTTQEAPEAVAHERERRRFRRRACPRNAQKNRARAPRHRPPIGCAISGTWLGRPVYVTSPSARATREQEELGRVGARAGNRARAVAQRSPSAATSSRPATGAASARYERQRVAPLHDPVPTQIVAEGEPGDEGQRPVGHEQTLMGSGGRMSGHALQASRGHAESAAENQPSARSSRQTFRVAMSTFETSRAPGQKRGEREWHRRARRSVLVAQKPSDFLNGFDSRRPACLPRGVAQLVGSPAGGRAVAGSNPGTPISKRPVFHGPFVRLQLWSRS